MISSGSRQTLLANLIQQACTAALLLALPNMLNKAVYAEIVFVGVLLSFIAIADLGLSLVYGRTVPGLIAQGDSAAVRQWDSTTFGFGLIGAMIFSALIAVLYWFRFGHVGQALLLLFLPVAGFWTSFHVTRVTVTGDFSEYGRAIGIRSVASLLAIPMVAMFGVMGWFVSQLMAALLVMVYVGRRLLEPFGRVDWVLVRSYVPEGLLLCAITVSWLQMLNFGRLYASVRYPAEEVAHYGVAGAAYQSLSALLISAFLPVSVGMLSHFGRGDSDAFSYMAKVLARSAWLALGVIAIVIEPAPFVFKIVFPGYQFDPWILFALLLGVAFYPFLILLGSCLVGKRRAGIYLATIVAGLCVSTVAAMTIDVFAPNQGAAWGQLSGLLFYMGCLYWVTRILFHEAAPETWNKIGKRMISVVLLVLAYVGLHWGWTSA